MLALSVWRTSALVRHLGRFDLGQAQPCKRRHFASNKKKRMLLLSLVSKHQSVPFAPPIGNAPSLNAAFSSASRSRLNPLAISRGLRLVIAFDACASEFSTGTKRTLRRETTRQTFVATSMASPLRASCPQC